MKKWIALLTAVLALVLALAAMAEEPPEVTLRAGKYIIGQEIEAGTYTLTCTGTDGEQMNDAYGALGSAFDKLDGSGGSEYSTLFGALGGLMENYVDLTREIIGNYGDVLKSYSLKTGETMNIVLEEGTALQISDGSCTLVKAQ